MSTTGGSTAVEYTYQVHYTSVTADIATSTDMPNNISHYSKYVPS